MSRETRNILIDTKIEALEEIMNAIQKRIDILKDMKNE